MVSFTMFPLSSIAAAFISPASHAWSNIADASLNKALPHNLTFLIAISKVAQALFILPLLFFFPISLHLTPLALGAIIIVVAIEFLYVYPYLWSFNHADTSIVAALFSLGEILIPVLAWLVLGEVLQPTQYLGFAVIIAASLMLTFHPQNFKLNLSALFMLGASLLLAVSATTTKLAFQNQVEWFTFTIYTVGLEGFVGLFILAARPHSTLQTWRSSPRNTHLLFGVEAFTSCIGNAGGILALSLLPVTICKAISATQPLFIMLYTTLFGRRFPRAFEETRSGLPPLTKLIAFALTILGTVLTLGH